MVEYLFNVAIGKICISINSLQLSMGEFYVTLGSVRRSRARNVRCKIFVREYTRRRRRVHSTLSKASPAVVSSAIASALKELENYSKKCIVFQICSAMYIITLYTHRIITRWNNGDEIFVFVVCTYK